MRRRIVAGNWKMNTTYTEAMALVDALKEVLPKK
jgi:triosephosphate isomerase